MIVTYMVIDGFSVHRQLQAAAGSLIVAIHGLGKCVATGYS